MGRSAVVVPFLERDTDLVERALLSVAKQTDLNIPPLVILVTDKTGEARLRQGGGRVMRALDMKVVRLEGMPAVGRARNEGARHAISCGCSHALFLDHDDVLRRNALATLTSVPPSALVTSNCRRVDSRGNVLYMIESKPYWDLRRQYFLTRFDPTLHVIYACHPLFVNLPWFVSVGGFDERLVIGEMIDFFARVSLLDPPTECLDDYLYDYSLRANSLVARFREELEGIRLHSLRTLAMRVLGTKKVELRIRGRLRRTRMRCYSLFERGKRIDPPWLDPKEVIECTR